MEPIKPRGHVGFRRKLYMSKQVSPPIHQTHSLGLLAAPTLVYTRCVCVCLRLYVCTGWAPLPRLSATLRLSVTGSHTLTHTSPRIPDPRNPPTPRQSRALRANPISSEFRHLWSRRVSNTSEVPLHLPSTRLTSVGLSGNFRPWLKLRRHAWIITHSRTAQNTQGSILHSCHVGQRRIMTKSTG